MTNQEPTTRKLFFLVAQPRSGNTLFASIMNQNKDIAATANSLTLEIIKDLFLLKSKADKPGRSNYIYLKNLEYTEQSIIKLISNKTTYTLKQRP